MVYFVLAIFLVILDQVVKFWVVERIGLYETVEFLPPFMELTYVQNTGAAFSMLSGHTWALAVVSLVMSVALVIMIWKKVFSLPFGLFSLTLVLAGAVGNMIDRVFRGFVVDMFDFMFVRFAVFNVADVCVVIGGILSGYYYLYLYEKYDMKAEIQGEEGVEVTDEGLDKNLDEVLNETGEDGE